MRHTQTERRLHFIQVMKTALRSLAISILLSLWTTWGYAQVNLREHFSQLVAEFGAKPTNYYAGGADQRGHIYIVPNEPHPELAQKIFKNAPFGAYISVGSERGLIGAALSPNVSALVLIDLVPEVVRFNTLNIILLTLASDRADYLRMRTATSIAEWQHHSDIHDRLSEAQKEFFLEPANFEFFKSVHGPATERLLNPEYFIGTSYLREDLLFDRIATLAPARRIVAFKGNLLDQALIRRVEERLRRIELPVAILDVSNAWEPQYTGLTGLRDLVRNLSQSMTNKTVILTTRFRSKIAENLYHWDYQAFQKQTLDSVYEKVPLNEATLSLLSQGNRLPINEIIEPKDLTESNLIDISGTAKQIRWSVHLEKWPWLRQQFLKLTGLDQKLPGGSLKYYRDPTPSAGGLRCNAVHSF